MRPAYRCDDCVNTTARCVTCRVRRAAAVRERRAAKRAEGTCSECHRRALPEQSRCRLHAAENNRRSSAAHREANS